jgi:hypothetical protein
LKIPLNRSSCPHMKLVLEDLDHEVVLLFPESGTSVGNCATVLNFTRRWSQI